MKIKNILLIILFIVMANISYASEIKNAAPQKQDSLTAHQEPVSSKYSSPELTGAIFGALSAGLVTLLIKLGQWFFNRRTFNKILRKGLYFKIENHKIVELQPDSDNQPNFAIASFNDNFYNSNLSNISKILYENLLQRLTFYYSHLKLAVDYQNELFKVNEKISKNISTSNIVVDEMLSDKKKDLKESMRLILAVSQFIRNNLLAELTKIFKDDPTKLTFIDVMPKYREWFKGIQKKRQRD